MKKKLVCIMTAVLVVVTACLCLVGCSPKTPDKFMESFKEANSKVVYRDNGDGFIALNGDVIYRYYGDDDYEEHMYMTIEGDKIVEYHGLKDGKDAKIEWKKYSVNKEDFFYKNFVDLKSYFNDLTDIDLYDFKFDLEKDFDKNGDWYVGKKDTDYEDMAIKIKGKEMYIQYEFDKNKKDDFDEKYVIGYKSISIPKEAKDAPEEE